MKASKTALANPMRRDSISNFIQDLIIEEQPIEMEQTPLLPTIPNEDENIVRLDSDEDSFLEFIKEKPQIGQSAQANTRYDPQPNNSVVKNSSFAISPRGLNQSAVRDYSTANKSLADPALSEIKGLFRDAESSDEESKHARGSKTVKARRKKHRAEQFSALASENDRLKKAMSQF